MYQCSINVLGFIGEIASTITGNPLKKGWATYGMGFLHGLQPDSLVMVLPSLALPTRLAAATYITMFVFGTVVAMGGYSLAIGMNSPQNFIHSILLHQDLSRTLWQYTVLYT